MYKKESHDPHGEQQAFAPGEQGLHQDYSNNTLVVPKRAPEPTEVVSCIFYFSDIAEHGGATCVLRDQDLKAAVEENKVPRTYATSGFDDVNELSRRYQTDSSRYGIRQDNTHPLYDHEMAVEYRPGTALLYKFDTLHRGTPVKPGGARFTVHVGLRRAAAEVSSAAPFASSSEASKKRLHQWTSMHATVIRNGAYPQGYIGSLSPFQRTVIQFPAPGHRYWTRETCQLVANRYDGWDAAPYLAALANEDATTGVQHKL